MCPPRSRFFLAAGGRERRREGKKERILQQFHDNFIRARRRAKPTVRSRRCFVQSLTLTQLAELHDKVCLLTSTMVRQDEPIVDVDVPAKRGRDPLQADYDALNRRIAALQKQIGDKQTEAGRRIQELRQALRFEQSSLIQIAERMNLEKRRNLELRLTMDKMPK